ncbi:MAG: hypothetical protein R3E39_20215 [Anaerolineae bacterium]
MRRQMLMICCLCAVLLVVGIHTPPTSAQTDFRYRLAYVTQAVQGITLHVLNPADPLAPAEIIPLPTTEGKRLYGVNVSPDGQWMLATMKSGDEDPPLLRLYTSDMQAHRDFNLGNMAPSWSPDSHWLMLPIYNWAGSLYWFTLSVYDLQTDTLLNFTNSDEHYPYSYAWSDDSTRLAVVSRVCDTVPCYTQLEIYDTATWEATVYTNPAPSTLCRLVWSPDNQSLAFNYSCEVGVSQWITDVFVWSLPQDTWIPVSHRTQPLTDDEFITNLSYSFDHTYLWLNPETLLTASIGGRYREGGGYEDATFSYDTRIYNITRGTDELLDPRILTDWQVSPANPHLYSYRRESYELYDSESSMRLWRLTASQVEIATYDGTAFSPIYSTDGGCNMEWSPDGRYLAHTDVHEGFLFCRGGNKTIKFIDSATMTNISISLEESGENYPIGWLFMP